MRSWVSRMDEYVHAPPETLATLERAVARGKGIVLVLGHIGNWELTCRVSRHVLPNAVIAKRSWHPRIDAMAERSRAVNQVETFWRDDPATARAMLRLFRQAGTLGILIDQDIRDVQSVFVPFFGRPARTPRAAADLALRFGATVLVVDLPPARPAGRRRPPPRGGGGAVRAGPRGSRGGGDPAHRRLRRPARGGDPPPSGRVGLDAPALEVVARLAPPAVPGA